MLRSPPSRRRGLKYQMILQTLRNTRRLLRGGVDWNLSLVDEISEWQTSRLLRGGVDWNLQSFFPLHDTPPSPPSRRRGLKLPKVIYTKSGIQSPPSRRRGLKYPCWYNWSPQKQSPPSRRRGLKLLTRIYNMRTTSRLLRGGVDWNTLTAEQTKPPQSPPSRRRGLKSVSSGINPEESSRLLRGGVDWNLSPPE